jgi:hypothetical protein
MFPIMKVACFPVFILLSLTLYTPSAVQPDVKLLFRENWKEIEAALPVTQEHVANPHLVLGLYGAARDEIKKSNHPHIPNDPYYIWSGECRANWAVTLKHRNGSVDLTGSAKVRANGMILSLRRGQKME